MGVFRCVDDALSLDEPPHLADRLLLALPPIACGTMSGPRERERKGGGAGEGAMQWDRGARWKQTLAWNRAAVGLADAGQERCTSVGDATTGNLRVAKRGQERPGRAHKRGLRPFGWEDGSARLMQHIVNVGKWGQMGSRGEVRGSQCTSG